MSEPSEGNAERVVNTTEDWREITEKMTTDGKYQYMLEHDIHTDCTFVVGPEDGETREFKAHRLQVARESAVFEAMLLRGEMVEAKTGHVRVTDLSPNTFQLLLSSIYGKSLWMMTFQELQNSIYAAEKYQMKALLENCMTWMSALITPENIWTALETAELFQGVCLKRKCIQVLQRDTLRCITDAGFMQASEENVALLLEQDKLNVDDEQLLVNTIVHWARHAARQRGVSDDDSGVRAVLEPRLLSLFRLLAMSPQQFMLGPGLAGWLTSDEKAAISECLESVDISKLPQNLCSINSKRINVVVAKIEDCRPPVCHRSPVFICKREIFDFGSHVEQGNNNCCNDTYQYQYYKCLHAMLIFETTSRCKWLGFQCASRYKEAPASAADPSAENSIYMENIIAKSYIIKHFSTDYKKFKISKTSYVQKTKYNSTISVKFDEPVRLVPNRHYAIEVKFRQGENGPAGEYPNHIRAVKVRTAAGVEFVFDTKERKKRHSSVNDGIIESLIFSL